LPQNQEKQKIYDRHCTLAVTISPNAYLHLHPHAHLLLLLPCAIIHHHPSSIVLLQDQGKSVEEKQHPVRLRLIIRPWPIFLRIRALQ
jgi:hypothetical protein